MIYATPNSFVAVDGEEYVSQYVIWAAKTRITFGDLVITYYAIQGPALTSSGSDSISTNHSTTVVRNRYPQYSTPCLGSNTDYVYTVYVVRTPSFSQLNIRELQLLWLSRT